MAESCKGCFDSTPPRSEDCPGLRQTISVGTAVERFIIQVCSSPSLADTPPRLSEFTPDGPGVIIVHQQGELTHQKAVEIAEGFNI